MLVTRSSWELMTYSTNIRLSRNQSEPPSTDMPSGIFLSPSRHIWVSHSKKSRSKPCFLMNLLAIINNANYKFIFIGYKRHPSVQLARATVSQHHKPSARSHVSTHRALSLPWDLMKFISLYLDRKATSWSLVLRRDQKCWKGKQKTSEREKK